MKEMAAAMLRGGKSEMLAIEPAVGPTLFITATLISPRVKNLSIGQKSHWPRCEKGKTLAVRSTTFPRVFTHQIDLGLGLGYRVEAVGL
jgi:hypothetical protein